MLILFSKRTCQSAILPPAQCKSENAARHLKNIIYRYRTTEAEYITTIHIALLYILHYYTHCTTIHIYCTTIHIALLYTLHYYTLGHPIQAVS